MGHNGIWVTIVFFITHIKHENIVFNRPIVVQHEKIHTHAHALAEM